MFGSAVLTLRLPIYSRKAQSWLTHISCNCNINSRLNEKDHRLIEFSRQEVIAWTSFLLVCRAQKCNEFSFFAAHFSLNQQFRNLVSIGLNLFFSSIFIRWILLCFMLPLNVYNTNSGPKTMDFKLIISDTLETDFKSNS